MADESVDPTNPVPPTTPAASGAPQASEPEVVEPVETTTATPESAAADDVVEAELVEPEATQGEPLADTGVIPEAAYENGPQYVVVEAPRLPRKHGNRGIGSLLAVLGAVVFGVLLVGATYLYGLANGSDSLVFVQYLKFYVPIVIFAIAFVLLVLIVNRGAWWAYILGSLVVGAIVYVGTAAADWGIDLLAVRMGQASTDEVNTFVEGLASPLVIIPGILGREVALWWGSLIAHRGRRMTAKNRVAREDFDRRLAEFHEKYGRTAA